MINSMHKYFLSTKSYSLKTIKKKKPCKQTKKTVYLKYDSLPHYIQQNNVVISSQFHAPFFAHVQHFFIHQNPPVYLPAKNKK